MKNSCTHITTKYLGNNKQSGLSLIEMMIAMLIGLFLLLGITTSYLSSKKSSNTRDQISILEDNGRAALEVMTKTLQHAGYKSTGLIPFDESFKISAGKPASVSCGGENSVINTNFPVTNIDDNDLTGDTIGVVYLGDDDLNTDCSGRNLPAACRAGTATNNDAPKIYNTFFIDADRNLQCAGSRSVDLVPIAENVENIQILYGINADDDKNFKSVDRYVRAADVGADWGLVVSIQIAMLIRTPNEIKDKAEAETFTLLDTAYTVPTADRYQRAVFSTTINMRNQQN